ncbi:MAG: hypothetical protein HOV78_11660 [Hamadaea sp.]|nr:hypothetical protein [Hamadaea sp.]
MTDVRYDRNSAGLEEVLLAEPMAECMNTYAHAGVTFFETIAVRGKTERYANSAEVIDDVDVTDSRSPRRVAHVVATVDYAAKLEWGDRGPGGREGHHTLSRVADALEAL